MTKKLLGNITPRLFTKPLRKLTRRTSEGFAVIDWLENDLDQDLLPHQKWLFTHTLELVPGGRHRHKQVLVTMPRRNTKTTVATYLTAYRLTHGTKSVLLSSAQLDTARESYLALEDLILDHPDVFGRSKFRRVNGQYEINLVDFSSRFKIVSANRRGGRGLSGGLIIEDEIREARDWEAHSAIEPAMAAVPDSQLWMMSNAGDRQSVVLNHFRARALNGEDPYLFIAEWSAEQGCALDDRDAWAAANPVLGRLFDESVLEAAMSKPAAEFRSENLNQMVPSLNEAINADAWMSCTDPGTLDDYRNVLATFFDMSPDLRHSSLMAAALLSDGRVRVETVAQWDSTAAVRGDVPGVMGISDWLMKIDPVRFGYIPSSTAALSTYLAQNTKGTELTGSNVTTICQELAELVAAGRIAHNGDEFLTGQIAGARKLISGDGWRFDRKDGWCDAAYSTAGAVYLARKIIPAESMKIITAKPVS